MDAATTFIALDPVHVLYLLVVGFIGGLVSGFIGSGGAFVLTPAMMSMGVPGIVAVASNICHKFPKALVGAIKRARYGQVDVKLGLVMGISAEAGMIYGARLQQSVQRSFGDTGSNLYVSAAFVVVLGVVGSYVLRDAWRAHRGGAQDAEEKVSRLARRIQAIHIPYTMVRFKSLDAPVSILFTVPLGFATGMLAATIAVGGFIGVPGMHYVLGAPSLMASATELVIAFVMGLGGAILYGWNGLVDIRLAMIILAGSLFGIQLGAIGTTYVKPHVIKLVMGAIMVLVLFSRVSVIPVYLSELGWIEPIGEGLSATLKRGSFAIMMLALVTGAVIILSALRSGMRAQREIEARTASLVSEAGEHAPGNFERFLVASDGSEFSAGAVREALRMARRCGARVRVICVVASDLEHEALGDQVLELERAAARAHLAAIAAQASAAGVECETEVVLGASVHDRIVEESELFRADLVFVGRRGRGALARIMVGGATVKIIEQGPCSVLVVPRAAEVRGRRFVVASDGSGAAAAAGRLASVYSAPVTAVSLAMIVATAAAKSADLIVLGSRSHSKEVLNRTQCAVLVVKAA